MRLLLLIQPLQEPSSVETDNEATSDQPGAMRRPLDRFLGFDPSKARQQVIRMRGEARLLAGVLLRRNLDRPCRDALCGPEDGGRRRSERSWAARGELGRSPDSMKRHLIPECFLFMDIHSRVNVFVNLQRSFLEIDTLLHAGYQLKG